MSTPLTHGLQSIEDSECNVAPGIAFLEQAIIEPAEFDIHQTCLDKVSVQCQASKAETA